jgi:hypothetical protein
VVYLAADGWDASAWPALVTLGRLGEDDLLVDLTRAGVLALTGNPAAAERTLHCVWAELRWPAETHELELVGVQGVVGLPGLATISWPEAITRLERDPERTRPLVVLASGAPADADAVRLAAAVLPGHNVGVVLIGDWNGDWRLHHRDGAAHLQPLGLELSPIETPPPATTAPPPASALTPILLEVDPADSRRCGAARSMVGPARTGRSTMRSCLGPRC